MVNITLTLPDTLKIKMVKHAEIKWSEVARRAIERKIKEIEIEEHIFAKSKLTQRDVDEIAHKINKEVFEEIDRQNTN
jgi:predicted CopG family antitoxin